MKGMPLGNTVATLAKLKWRYLHFFASSPPEIHISEFAERGRVELQGEYSCTGQCLDSEKWQCLENLG